MGLVDMTDVSMNRIANADNPFQGMKTYKRVLCVCSAGLLRSPTAAVVLSQEPFNHNTRACGLTKEFALIPFDQALAYWADEIVCMEARQRSQIQKMLEEWGYQKTVVCLSVDDNYPYRHPDLVKMISERYAAYLKQE